MENENYEKKRAPRDANDNVVFIGNKPFMNYVTGVVMQFTTQGASEVFIKARGKFIARAVDVAEVAAKRFLEGTVNIKDIKVNSEEFENKEGRQVRVSTIEILLGKR
ncbi:DNA-binding protein Alba [Candidatus Woesearchaeota archaeon]|nr:DNA-binding protein Alba [Candidatus Woesearchaeota archaeon]